MTDALYVHQISHTYANGFRALRDLTLRIPQGSFFALLGPNGAGKTTLIDLITGLSRHQTGQISLMGKPLSDQQSLFDLGVVPQEINFNIFQTIEQTLYYQAGFFGIPYDSIQDKMHHYLAELDLLDKRDKKVSQLSGGMKRRLMLARALVHQPKVLLLDEPTVGVDPLLRQKIWALLQRLNQEGMTILLTTHYLEEAEALCQDIAFIQQGCIPCQGRLTDLIRSHNKQKIAIHLGPKHPTIETLPSNWQTLSKGDSVHYVSLDQTLSIDAIKQTLQKMGVHFDAIEKMPPSLDMIFFDYFDPESTSRL